MQYIKVKNDGLVDIKAFTLLGGSTKRNDASKIGFFGSGLKYAIAVLLRNNIAFKIFRGTEEITITTKEEEFRGEIFNKIFINGIETSMTKEMGIDWKAWYCIREIYCNAIDEENGLIAITEGIVPKDNETHFYIELKAEMDELINNWNDYFTNRRNDIVLEVNTEDKNNVMTIFQGNQKEIIYRRGVQCYFNNPTWREAHHALYHYDVGFAEINESRVLSNYYTTTEKIVNGLAGYATTEMIKNIFNSYTGAFEADLPWESAKMFNESWLEVVGPRKLVPHDFAGNFAGRLQREEMLILPGKLLRALMKYFKGKIEVAGSSDEYANHVIVDADKKQAYILKESLSFLKESGFEVVYPIKIGLFKDKKVLGTVDDSSIILAAECFEHGKKKTVETIIEEAFHLETKLRDETRAFQDHLINRFVSLLEAKSGIIL